MKYILKFKVVVSLLIAVAISMVLSIVGIRFEIIPIMVGVMNGMVPSAVFVLSFILFSLMEEKDECIE